MTATTHRPSPLDHAARPTDRDARGLVCAVLPNGNPVIPVPASTHPAEELVHPWED